MMSSTFADALRSFYSREDVQLSFLMLHPTAADREPHLDWSSMENYERSARRRAEFHLERYQWSERNP